MPTICRRLPNLSLGHLADLLEALAVDRADAGRIVLALADVAEPAATFGVLAVLDSAAVLAFGEALNRELEIAAVAELIPTGRVANLARLRRVQIRE
jgi:hypothetical protein